MSWLEEYFLSPVLQNGWFNPINTLVYSIILVIAVWAVYKLVLKMKIPIDSKFALALLPFIFWGSSTRVLHDAAVAGVLKGTIYDAPFFVTPGSYFITFGLTLGVLLVSLLIQKVAGTSRRFLYWKPMLIIGLALCAWNLVILPLPYLLPLALIVPIALLWTGLIYLPKPLLFKLNLYPKFQKSISRFFSKGNMGILGSHYLDASATFFALSLFGYLEQHVVPRLLIPFMGPASMFLLKTAVLLPVLYLIDRYSEDTPQGRSLKNFLKIVILILGLAPGLRDLLRLMAQV